MIASFLFKHKCFFVKGELRIHNLIFALNVMFNQNRNIWTMKLQAKKLIVQKVNNE